MYADTGEMQKYISDLEMQVAYLEQHAASVVKLCEELSLEKQILEIRKKESDYHAQHDTLTGLLNRATMDSMLEALFREKDCDRRTALICFADLDNFKEINDEYGHAVGDDALVQFSRILRETFNSGEIIGRIGGDEFVIVKPWSRTPSTLSVLNIEKNLKSGLKSLNDSNDYGKNLGASIGIISCARNDICVKKILQAADALMYQAKNTRSATSLKLAFSEM